MNSATYTAQREAFAAIADAMYPGRCTISRRRKATTSAGGTTNADVPIYSNVPVSYRPASAREIAQASKTFASAAYTIRIPAEYQGDALTVDSTFYLEAAAIGNEPARTFHIEQVLRDGGISITLLGTVDA